MTNYPVICVRDGMVVNTKAVCSSLELSVRDGAAVYVPSADNAFVGDIGILRRFYGLSAGMWSIELAGLWGGTNGGLGGWGVVHWSRGVLTERGGIVFDFGAFGRVTCREVVRKYSKRETILTEVWAGAQHLGSKALLSNPWPYLVTDSGLMFTRLSRQDVIEGVLLSDDKFRLLIV